MSNTFGTTTPTVVTNRVIDFLKEMFPPVIRMFIDFTPQQVLKGQSITTRIPSVGAAYDASSGYAAVDVTDTDKSVTASNFKAASCGFSAAELSTTNRDLIDEHAGPLANALGADLLDVMCALFTSTNYANETVEQAANYDDETLRNVRKALKNRKANGPGLGIINADAFAPLSGDSLVTTQDTNPSAASFWTSGAGRLTARGFDIVEYAQLPANSEQLNGVFMTPGAMIGAVGIPKDSNADGYFPSVPNVALVEPVTDPDTGITLLQRLSKGRDGDIQMDLAWIFGFAAGDPARLQRVNEAATSS